MTLKQRIENDIKEAMRAKNQTELLALRSIKSMILLAETEKGAAGEVPDDTVNKILMKAAKQREESAALYQEQKRDDLASKEIEELNIIRKYLPEQLSPEEIDSKVKEIIQEVGASSMGDMGKVMGKAMKVLGGAADGKAISASVKKHLG